MKTKKLGPLTTEKVGPMSADKVGPITSKKPDKTKKKSKRLSEPAEVAEEDVNGGANSVSEVVSITKETAISLKTKNIKRLSNTKHELKETQSPIKLDPKSGNTALKKSKPGPKSSKTKNSARNKSDASVTIESIITVSLEKYNLLPCQVDIFRMQTGEEGTILK